MTRRAVAQLSMLAVSLASACSSSPPLGTPTQPVRSGNQIGDGSSSPATDPQAGSPDHQGDRAAVSTATAVQPDLKSRGASAPTRRAEVGRSQTDVDNAMRKRGYKPAIYQGERVYCKNEPITGSNLESKVCLTAVQIEDQERAAKDILNRNRPAGCSPKNPCN
jgi:hypothetical protein